MEGWPPAGCRQQPPANVGAFIPGSGAEAVPPEARPDDEAGRTRRWMCSWLYKLRACDVAEAIQAPQRASEGGDKPQVAAGRCRSIPPPDHAASTGDSGLGWGGIDITTVANLDPLLFSFRCW